MVAARELDHRLPELSILQKPQKGSLFRISKQYEQEKKPELLAGSIDKIRQFDLSFSFAGLPRLIEQFGEERGIFQAVLGVMLNIWSLRQEMLGEVDTRELITLVLKQEESFTFSNDLYGQAKDLYEMYKQSLHSIPLYLCPRYDREANQAIKVLEILIQSLNEIDFSLPSELLEEQLKLYGFHEEEIDVSPSMVANVKSLRDQIHSADALQSIIHKKKKIKAWVSPFQTLSGSPPHWSHHLGETIFVWASECVVLPDTKEIFVRQNGKFGKGEEADLLRYLAFNQQEFKVFSTEDDIMEFINILMMENYKQPKVLLDFLVQKLGGIQSVGKIDKHIKEGNLDIRPYYEAVMELFSFEWKDMDSPRSAMERLGDLSDKILHQIARNQPKALQGLVKKYKDVTQSQPFLSIDAFHKTMNATALRLDSGFKIKIDLSLLDCVAGSPLSFAQQMAGNMELRLDMNARKFISQIENQGLQTFDDVKRFCQIVGKDPKKYTTRRKCRMCPEGKENTFVWGHEHGGCDVCPYCEWKDDMGIAGKPIEFSESEDGEGFTVKEKNKYFGVMNLTDLVASIPCPTVMERYRAAA